MRLRPKPSLATIWLVLLVLIGSYNVPYILLTPGPVFSTIGEVDGEKFISISGTQTFPTEGDLYMTTVSEYGGPTEGISIFQALWGWVSTSDEVAPRESFYDESVSEEENNLQNAEAFSSSQTYAVGAALKYLKFPVKESVVISSISQGAPALGLLKAGDQVISVNGVITKTPREVATSVRAKPVGSEITFVVTRANQETTVIVKSAAREDDLLTQEDESGIAYVGIGLDVQYEANFDITFAQTDIGGPSAGMMFSLAIVDMLTPGAITQGEKIAGTGTIDGNGEVGPIGGITRKMIGAVDAGAVLFLAPIDNCNEVINNVPNGLTVVPVKTLTDAVTAVNDFNAGKSVNSCESIN